MSQKPISPTPARDDDAAATWSAVMRHPAPIAERSGIYLGMALYATSDGRWQVKGRYQLFDVIAHGSGEINLEAAMSAALYAADELLKAGWLPRPQAPALPKSLTNGHASLTSDGTLEAHGG